LYGDFERGWHENFASDEKVDGSLSGRVDGESRKTNEAIRGQA